MQNAIEHRGFAPGTIAAQRRKVEDEEVEGAFSVQDKGSRANRLEDCAARVGCSVQGTVMAGASAQEGKHARGKSAKELKTGGKEAGLLLLTVNQPELTATTALPLPREPGIAVVASLPLAPEVS